MVREGTSSTPLLDPNYRTASAPYEDPQDDLTSSNQLVTRPWILSTIVGPKL